MDFLDMEINESMAKKIMIIVVVLIFIYALINLISYSFLSQYTLGPETITNDENIRTGISILERGSKMIEIQGWAYKQGQKIEIFDSCYVLRNQETGKMYKMKTSMEKVPELMSVDGMYDCSNARMHARCFIVGLSKGTYDVCVLYNNDKENILADTGIVLGID